MIARLISRLLSESPSIRAAMKAGRKTSISARRLNGATGEWEDLGVVSSSEESWRSLLSGIPQVVVRYRVNGREIERANL